MAVSTPDLFSGAVLVTGNPGKLAEARRLGAASLEAVDIDLPEIQSLDLREILRAKAAAAFGQLQERTQIILHHDLRSDFDGLKDSYTQAQRSALAAPGYSFRPTLSVAPGCRSPSGRRNPSAYHGG